MIVQPNVKSHIVPLENVFLLLIALPNCTIFCLGNLSKQECYGEYFTLECNSGTDIDIVDNVYQYSECSLSPQS